MRPCRLQLILAVVAAGFLQACGQGDPDSSAASTVDYEITITASSSFDGVGSDATQLPQQFRRFGPEVGYPTPVQVAALDAGTVARGSFFVFETSKGDLTEAKAAIADGSGNPPADAELHPDSGASAIAIPVPYGLAAGSYQLELSLPGDLLVAETQFGIEGAPPAIQDVRFEPEQPAAGTLYHVIFEFTPPGATITYVLAGDDGFRLFQIIPCVPPGSLCSELHSDTLPAGDSGVTDMIIPSIEINGQVVHVADPIFVTFE